MEKFDLDQYDISSHDFRSDGSNAHLWGINCKGHPRVPKLDLKPIIDDQIEAMKKKGSDSDSDDSEEIEVDESIQKDNLEFMYEGSALLTEQSMSRKESLLNRKEFVINVLNESY